MNRRDLLKAALALPALAIPGYASAPTEKSAEPAYWLLVDRSYRVIGQYENRNLREFNGTAWVQWRDADRYLADAFMAEETCLISASSGFYCLPCSHQYSPLGQEVMAVIWRTDASKRLLTGT
jgi:hypothetical protein